MVWPSDSALVLARPLRSQDEALPEQIEAGTAKHLALEQLQAGDLPFDGAV